jgi:hypothetical protein
MGRKVGALQVEPHTLQVAERPCRNVIQTIELEAERLLPESGGKCSDIRRAICTKNIWAAPGPPWSSPGLSRLVQSIWRHRGKKTAS